MANRNAAHTKLVRAVIEYLGYKGIPAWESKTQGQWDAKRGVYRKFRGKKGVADVTGVMLGTGRTIFVECKTGNAKLTMDQLNFRNEVETAHALYIVARNLDDVAAGLQP